MADPIPVDEYLRWVPPGQAIEQLKPTPKIVVMDALKSGIRSGGIRVAVHQTFALGTTPRLVGSYYLLEPGAWIDQATDRFWAFGGISIKPPRSPREVKLGREPDEPVMELSGLRLDPVGLGNLRVQQAASNRDSSSSTRRR